MRGEAVAYGAATLVNAMATGRGAAFGIDLWTKAAVELTDEKTIETRILGEEHENTLLAEKCIQAVFHRFRVSRQGAKVLTESNIPIARGLKSSSVAGNAIVLATLAALKKRLPPAKILKLVVKASLDANVSVTGALDDAAASLYGNVVVTDNLAGRVLRRFPVDDYCVLILVPVDKAYTANVDLRRIKTIAGQAEMAYKEALAGNYWNAMTLNGLVYSAALGLPAAPIIDGMEAGALAAGVSGKGPAYTFVVQDQFKEAVLDAMRRHQGSIIASRTRKRPSLSTHSLKEAKA